MSVEQDEESSLNGGKSGQTALGTQENRIIRPSLGCGENSVPSAVRLGYDHHESEGYLGNVGQEGTAYNGHFGCTCYHPLFLFNQSCPGPRAGVGDLERCSLRPGNVHSADGWRKVLEPVVERYRDRKLRRYFRADAAFASPEVYEFVEAEGFLYAIRLPANRVLRECIGDLLTRPVGRPPNHVRRCYASFGYRDKSWDKARCVVAKVEWHPGELFARVAGSAITPCGCSFTPWPTIWPTSCGRWLCQRRWNTGR